MLHTCNDRIGIIVAIYSNNSPQRSISLLSSRNCTALTPALDQEGSTRYVPRTNGTIVVRLIFYSITRTAVTNGHLLWNANTYIVVIIIIIFIPHNGEPFAAVRLCGSSSVVILPKQHNVQCVYRPSRNKLPSLLQFPSIAPETRETPRRPK